MVGLRDRRYPTSWAATGEDARLRAQQAESCIPVWDVKGYVNGMTTQIAIRLPDEMVRFLDRSVASGKAPSRAALVAAALEREMRLQAAQQDAQTLKEKGTSDDLDELVTWSVAHATLDD